MGRDELRLFLQTMTGRRGELKSYSKSLATPSLILEAFAMEVSSSKQVALSQGEICWSEENIINESHPLTAYGNPAQNLRMVEVSEPNAPSAGEALVRMECAPIAYSDLLLADGV